MRKQYLFACLVSLTACALEDEAFEETEQEGTSLNGVSLNGVSLNGVSLNGVSLNGVSLNGVSLNGVSLNGVSLNGVSLNGVSLNGVSLNGTSLTGVNTSTGATTTQSSIGTQLTASLSNGSTLKLRIDAAALLAAPNNDTWAYTVTYQADGTWKPLCGAGIQALQIAGTWGSTGAHAASSTNFTFACRGASIAKCVELGYKPAAGYTNQMLSCVRMLRGDYCGTGVTYTITGNQLNVYDALGIQKDTQTSWNPEAEWSPNGARCISQIKKTRFTTSGIATPPCVTSNALPATSTCAKAGFPSGTFLISEIP